ncbi:MAG: hypothetical protein U9O98_08255 [Asgard group archaeon]|nr:hypothetical protein [Asgard group archaeon]
MRLKKILPVVLVLCMFLPVFMVNGVQNTTPVNTVKPSSESSVGVVAGDTLYYTIDQFDMPDIYFENLETYENVTINEADIAGNKIYFKVMHVDDSYTADPITYPTEPFVRFGVGIQFTKDISITIGSGVEEVTIVLPDGGATPAMGVGGIPKFNISNPEGPAIFCLSDDYAAHEEFFDVFPVDVTVTNNADVFNVLLENTTTGGMIEANYRKSDGVLTHFLVDNFYATGFMNATGIVAELNLDEKVYRPLPVSVGDTITLNAEIADIVLEGTGDLYDEINQTEYTSVQNELDILESETVFKFVVDDVEGLYYLCSIYQYDMEEQELTKMYGQTHFTGFLGFIGDVSSPFYGTFFSPRDFMNPDFFGSLLASYNVWPAFAPAMTPDWDIYQGEALLVDTAMSVYLDDFLELEGPPEDEMIINSAEMTMGFTESRGYYFMTASMNVDMELNVSAMMDVPRQEAYTNGSKVVGSMEMYTGYSSGGIIASARMQMDMDMETYGIEGGTAPPSGTMNIDMDMKLVNPQYDPPEPGQGGFIPGFTWLISLPALFAVALAATIIRKRKA